MSQNPRTTLRTAPHHDDSSALLDRLLSQFPELSRDEAALAAVGVMALPGLEPAPTSPPEVKAPPRYRA